MNLTIEQKAIIYGVSFTLFCWLILYLLIIILVPSYSNLNNFNDSKFLFLLIILFGATSFGGGLVTAINSQKNIFRKMLILGVIFASLILIYRFITEFLTYFKISKDLSGLDIHQYSWVIESQKKVHLETLQRIIFIYPRTLVSQIMLTTVGGSIVVLMRNIKKR